MGETPGSGHRKRARPATNGGTAAGSATKKRKVGDSSAAKGEPTKRRSAGAPVGPGKKKTSLDRNHVRAPIPPDDDEKEEEDVDDETTTTPVKKTAKRKGQSPNERGRDPYDLLPSDGEESAAATSGQKKGIAAAGTSNGVKSKKRKSIPVTTVSDGDESEANVYDTMHINESPSKPPTEKKRGPGRPPGSKNKKTTAASLSNTHSLQLTPTKSRQVRRGLEGDVPASPTVLKGILTPSKKRNDDTPRRRKNVAFSAVGEEKDFEIYFDDLPTAKKSEAKKARDEKARTTPTRPGPKDTEEDELAKGGEENNEVEENEEDEDVCEICLKPDSNPPNEIIICDGCDLGFHQKCQNVPVIPEDDWFCKNCSQEDAAKTPQRPSAAAVAAAPPTDAPDIPNLDRHLAALQRVLLDRCTGKRRLNLVGLDEAHKKVEQLVEQTISGGESNSMLLIGGRGTGKTAVSNIGIG